MQALDPLDRGQEDAHVAVGDADALQARAGAPSAAWTMALIPSSGG
jgi:hypothetical protein